MTGDLVTSSQAAASRAKSRLAQLLKEPAAAEDLMLPSARQRLQALEQQPTGEELADVLLGIGKGDNSFFLKYK